MKCIGVDYHKKFSYATMIDMETGEMQARRLENTAEDIRAFIGEGADVRAVMEAGRCYGWYYDMLCGIVDDVTLAHPLKVKAIASARIKNDRIDSKILAQLLAADLIPEAHGRSAENRQALAVVRQRAFWVDMRTRFKNRVHDVIDRQGGLVGRPQCSDLFGKAGRVWLESVVLPSSERRLLDELLAGIDFTIRQIRASDRRIKQLFDADPVAQRLSTIPGIGIFFAVLIRLEIDDVRRFDGPEKLHAYAGLIPSTHQSGDTLRHGKLTKQGNRWLRWAMIEAVGPAVRSNWQLKQKHERQKERKNDSRKANVIMGRHLLTLVYRVWTQEREFEVYRKDHVKSESPSAPYNGASCSRSSVG